MAARDQLQNLFLVAKTLKLNVRNYSNSTISFLTIWRCAGDFFKVLLKFKMAVADQVRNYSNFISHSPLYGDVQVIFSGFTEIQNGRHG